MNRFFTLCGIVASFLFPVLGFADPPPSPTWGNLPAPSAALHPSVAPANSADPGAAVSGGIEIRLKSSREFVGIGSPNCPILVVNKNVWDLKTGKVIKRILITANDHSPFALSESGKLLALGISRDVHRNDTLPDAVIWDTQAGAILAKIPSVDRDRDVGFMGFAGDQWLLISSRTDGDRPAIMEVWNAQTGKLDHRFPCNFAGAQLTTVSPDGRYIAVGSDEKIAIYDIASGQVTSTLSAPLAAKSAVRVDMDSNHISLQDISIPFSGLAGLRFSPTGRQIAAVISASPFDESFRLLCWDSAGKLTDNFPFHLGREGTLGDGPLLTWSPDEKSWLVRQHWLIDRAAQHLVWCHPIAFADYARLTFLDPNHLLVIHSSNSDQGNIVPIPWDQIHAAQAAAANADHQSALYPSQTISVEISCLHPRGSELAAKTMLLDAITRRLAQDNIKIADNQPTVLHLELEEGVGDKVKIVIKRGPFDLQGTDTGRTAWEARGVIHLTIKNRNRPEALFETYLQGQGYPSGRVAITDASLRTELIRELSDGLLHIPLPYYLSGDGAKLMLPLGLKGEIKPRDFLKFEPTTRPATPGGGIRPDI